MSKKKYLIATALLVVAAIVLTLAAAYAQIPTTQDSYRKIERPSAPAFEASAPVFQAQQEPRRVLVISIDAAKALDVWSMARNGTLRCFARFINEGIYGDLAPVFPAETSPNHAAMLTGAPTGIHGVISNRPYLRSPFEGGRPLNGYHGSALMAETLWEAADRAGMTVAVSNFIHSFVPTWRDKLSDRVVIISLSKGYSSGVPVLAAPAVWTVRDIQIVEPREVVPNPTLDMLFVARVYINETRVDILVTQLQGRRFAHIYIDGRNVTKVEEGRWGAVTAVFRVAGTEYNATFMVKPLTLSRAGFRFFKGNALIYNDPVPWFKGPEELKIRYWREVATRGYVDVYFFPRAVRAALDLVTIAEAINRTVDWYWATNKFLFNNVNFRLFIGYDVTPDPVMHAILGLFDPDALYSNASLAAWARSAYIGMWQRIDRHLCDIVNQLRPNDILIVAGDHGQWQIKGMVRVNVALRKAGLLALDDRGNVDFRRSAAYYDGSYIYINPKLRTDPATYSRVVDQVVEAVLGIRDPATGERPIAMVLARRSPTGPFNVLYGDERSFFYLDGPAASRMGDVIIVVKPGYCSYDRTATGDLEVVVPVLFETIGCHDGAGTWAEVRGIIGIIGGRAVEIRKMYINAWMPQVGSTAAAALGITLKNATAPPIWITR
ncbi:MAG: alkaline phosphatase family protein [Pyrobaculum sp.]